MRSGNGELDEGAGGADEARPGRSAPRLAWPGKGGSWPPPALLGASERFEAGAAEANGAVYLGDNAAVMRALLEARGASVDLVYVDPPFATGQSFSRLGAGGPEGSLEAFRDTWGGGVSAYLSALLPRIELMRALLKNTGSLFFHCDWRTSHYVRCLLDEVFGPDCFKNEIVWRYRRWPSKTRVLQRMHDTIFWYGKTPGDAHAFEQLFEPLAESTKRTFGTRRQVADFSSGRRKPGLLDEESKGAPLSDVWDIGIVAPIARERCGYPTQKPEALLRRVVTLASRPGDLVADFFCGSGTTLVAAASLGRRFLGCDAGELAVQMTRRRLADLGGGASFELVEARPWAPDPAALAAFFAEALGPGGPEAGVWATGEPAGAEALGRAVEEAAKAGSGALDLGAPSYELGALEEARERARRLGLALRAFLIPSAWLFASAESARKAGPGRRLSPPAEVPELEARLEREGAEARVALRSVRLGGKEVDPDEVLDAWAVDPDVGPGEFRASAWLARPGRRGGLPRISPAFALRPGARVAVRVVCPRGFASTHLVEGEPGKGAPRKSAR